MKKCSKCQKELALDNFTIVNKKTGKISSMCKECLKIYNREYWERVKHFRNPIKNKQTQARRQEIRKYIFTLLQNSECMDCGITDWRVLEFDHRDRKQKRLNIADATKYSIKTVQTEIEKCDVVCANCHNIRTIKQRNYYANLF